nr:uncharacterized protein LOC113811042 [Penaeus vannamei]
MASRTSAILLLLFAQALSVAYTERRTLSTNLPSTVYMQPRQPGLLTVDFTFEFAERTVKHQCDLVSSVIWFEIKLFQASRELLEGFRLRRKALGQVGFLAGLRRGMRISESWLMDPAVT